jgi:hypothetical protein
LILSSIEGKFALTYLARGVDSIKASAALWDRLAVRFVVGWRIDGRTQKDGGCG